MNRRRLLVIVAMIGALVSVGALLACYGPQYDSIHFNSGSPNYLRPPRLRLLWDENEERGASPWRSRSEAGYLTQQEEMDALWAEAQRREHAAQFVDAARAYARYVNRREENSAVIGPALAEVRERIELLRGPTANSPWVITYLRARDLEHRHRKDAQGLYQRILNSSYAAARCAALLRWKRNENASRSPVSSGSNSRRSSRTVRVTDGPSSNWLKRKSVSMERWRPMRDV